MMKTWTLCALMLLTTANARGQAVGYTDEAAFLTALAALGAPVVQEGFEDDAAWGSVRTTIAGGQFTAPSITNLGVTWYSSSANNGITTGSGPARTGQWGFFSLPHGDYINGIGDGFGGTGSQPMVAIGGWIESNTPPAKGSLELDGVTVGFTGPLSLNGVHTFIGAIDPAGFSSFMFLETEGTIGDQKFIFADDFSFAFGGAIIDCNLNLIADVLDISSGTSLDCNLNGVPDECEIDANSSAPGGPFFCTSGCAPDCNRNAVPDECEVVAPVVHSSGLLSPIGNTSPQSFVIVQPPDTLANVIMDFTAAANLGGMPDLLAVDINGVPVGTVFSLDGSDCPEQQPDTTQLIVPRSVFNAAVGGGNAVIGLVASDEVDPFGCNTATYVSVDLTLWVSSAADLNGNGVPDECEAVSYCTAGTSAAGCQATVTGTGVASATATSGFDLLATGAQGAKDGLFFFGANGRQANPWGSGTSYQCVTPPVSRTGLLTGTGTPGNCDGSFSVDLNALWCPTCPKPAKNPGAGAVVQAQLWYRDPQNTSNQTTSLSDATEFVVQP